MDITAYAKDIFQQCFWHDYKIDAEEVKRIIENGTESERSFLISKMIQNYSFPESMILFFDKEILISAFPANKPKHQHQQIRYNNLKYLIYGEQCNEATPRHAWAL